MNVYFIRSGKKGPIKIGVANNVSSRLSELQIGNPFELSIVAIIPFSSRKKAESFEKKIHKRFVDQRIRGEWFAGNININKLMTRWDLE